MQTPETRNAGLQGKHCLRCLLPFIIPRNHSSTRWGEIETLPRRFAPVIEVSRAFGVMLSWECTAELTGDFRHHSVALACCETALERVRAALATQLSAAERAYLRAIEAQAQAETRVEASRQMIAASRALLDKERPDTVLAAE